MQEEKNRKEIFLFIITNNRPKPKKRNNSVLSLAVFLKNIIIMGIYFNFIRCFGMCENKKERKI